MEHVYANVLCPDNTTLAIQFNVLGRSPRPKRGTRRQRTTSVTGAESTDRDPIIRDSRRTIYTAGRPPWYDRQGQLVEPFVIGICGGSASGKTTVANEIIKQLGEIVFPFWI